MIRPLREDLAWIAGIIATSDVLPKIANAPALDPTLAALDAEQDHEQRILDDGAS